MDVPKTMTIIRSHNSFPLAIDQSVILNNKKYNFSISGFQFYFYFIF